MLIDPTTTAVTSGSYSMRAGGTLQARGTLAETIEIEIPDGAGGWQALTENGSAVVLDADNLQITCYGNTLIRVNKPTTGAAVGVKGLA